MIPRKRLEFISLEERIVVSDIGLTLLTLPNTAFQLVAEAEFDTTTCYSNLPLALNKANAIAIERLAENPIAEPQKHPAMDGVTERENGETILHDLSSSFKAEASGIQHDFKLMPPSSLVDTDSSNIETHATAFLVQVTSLQMKNSNPVIANTEIDPFGLQDNFLNETTQTGSDGIITSFGAAGPGGPGNNATHLKQFIPLNADNDNGSAINLFMPQGGGQGVPQHIPVTYDFQTSNYSDEDDLLSLRMVKNTPPAPGTSEGGYRYKLLVTNNVVGGDLTRIKIWKDTAKTVQLPIDGQWTEVGMTPIPFMPLKAFPGFWMEGLKPGIQVDEFTISLVTENDFNGVKINITYQDVDVTVTPVIHSIVNSAKIDPRLVESSWSNWDWAAYMQFDLTATTDYDQDAAVISNGQFDIKYVQHVRDVSDELPGGFHAYIDQQDGYIDTIIKDHIGPNFNYWFLDSNTDSAPYYPIDKDYYGPMPERQHSYKFDDQPGGRVKTNNAWIITDLDYIDEFRLEVVWSNQHTTNCDDIIYPIGWLDWAVEYHISNRTTGANNATNVICSFVYSDAPQYPYVPMFAGDAIRTIKMPR